MYYGSLPDFNSALVICQQRAPLYWHCLWAIACALCQLEHPADWFTFGLPIHGNGLVQMLPMDHCRCEAKLALAAFIEKIECTVPLHCYGYKNQN